MRVGRFRLDDLITKDAAGSVWRATDERLCRRVTLRVVLPHDPRRDEIRQAACRAARVDDPHVARVLDVLDVDGTLVIVSEWLDARTLPEILSQPLSPAAAVDIAMGVAQAVGALASSGVNHGRITPSTVLVTSSGMVKLRGHAIGEALWGPEVDGGAPAADIFGIGSVLMACLTGRWPTGPRDDLPAVPVIGRDLASPGRLVADVSPFLDQIVMRCLAAASCVRGRSTATPYPDLNAVISALALARHEVAINAPVIDSPRRSRLARRLGGALIAAASVSAIAAIGMALVLASSPEDTASVRSEDSSAAWKPPPTPVALEPEVLRLPPEIRIPVKRAWSISADQAGQIARSRPGTDSPTSGPGAAFDEDTSSAWQTAVFKSDKSARASGTALVIDLGAEHHVRALDVSLLGPASDIRIASSARPPRSSADLETLAELAGAPPLASVRLPRPVRTRYLAIQFNRMPLTTSGYRSGISHLAIRGLAD